tara:strand:+ start:74 stop:295 length:222 start_codon:yes stop_codon:yes gene_type:complete
MTYQQALYVKKLLQEGFSLGQIAERYYRKYGITDICQGPDVYTYEKGKKKYSFSNLQGNDIKCSASLILREKL